MAKPYEKDTKVGFWDYDKGKFVWVTGIIIKVRKTKVTNYKIKADKGEVYYKFHPKLTIIN